MRPIARLLPVLFAIYCCGCTGQVPAAPARDDAAAAPPPAASSATLARLRALAADAACTDDAQCRTLPLGATPCGGPQGYLPWSAARGTGDELRALGERYQAERRAENAAAGRMGACRFSPDPGAVCQSGTCRLGTPGFLVQ